MKYKGLCSVTFRGLTVESIIELAKGCGLDCIEWGGDVHVPPSDVENAKRVGSLTRESGLKTLSYGSYYRFREDQDYESVILACNALGAKTVRVWAGEKDGEKFTETEYGALVEKVREVATLAGRYGITVAFEFHFNTYCNTAENALRLISDVSMPNVLSYWQPSYWHEPAEEEYEVNMCALRALSGKIAGVHVYKWRGCTRLALSEGEKEWHDYAQTIGDAPYYLEFVAGDEQEQFAQDCKTLKKITE